MNYDSTRVKIDLDAISANFDAIAAKTKVPVMAVVKADAYGHGAIQVAQLLQDRCAFFGVSSLLEATELRRAGLTTPILILGHTPTKAFPTVIREGIRPTIFRWEDAVALSDAAVAEGIPAPFHLAVDTGMSRLGFPATEEAADICAVGCTQAQVEAELDRIGGVRYHYPIAGSSNVHFDIPKEGR